VAGSDPSAADPVEGPGGECGFRFAAVLRREATVSVFPAANCDSGRVRPCGWGWLGLFQGQVFGIFSLVPLQVDSWKSFD
jgi:hypothetical protein